MSHEPVFLMSDFWGQYMPKEFVEGYEFKGASDSDINIILEGPEHELYWEAWDNICDSAYMMIDGVKHTLFHSGDLYAIPDGYDFENSPFV